MTNHEMLIQKHYNILMGECEKVLSASKFNMTKNTFALLPE